MAHKTVRVVVTAPAGRYYPGLGGRECGEHYELPLEQAQHLVRGDSGLRIEAQTPKATRASKEE